MNVTAEKRTTTNMRRIRKGEQFIESGEVFECTGHPEVVDDEYVRVPLRRTHNGARSRRYYYNGDHRVKIVGRS